MLKVEWTIFKPFVMMRTAGFGWEICVYGIDIMFNCEWLLVSLSMCLRGQRSWRQRSWWPLQRVSSTKLSSPGALASTLLAWGHVSLISLSHWTNFQEKCCQTETNWKSSKLLKVLGFWAWIGGFGAIIFISFELLNSYPLFPVRLKCSSRLPRIIQELSRTARSWK